MPLLPDSEEGVVESITPDTVTVKVDLLAPVVVGGAADRRGMMGLVVGGAGGGGARFDRCFLSLFFPILWRLERVYLQLEREWKGWDEGRKKEGFGRESS